MSLVTPGKYAAHPERLSEEKFADVYENDKGNLILLMAYRLDDSGHVLRHYTCLAINGEIRQWTIEDLKARFGWDGVDLWWFETADLAHVEVEAVIEDEPGTDGKIWSRIKWINTPGGRGGSYTPKQVDRRALSTKYSSLFRAVAGPQPVKAAPKPAAPPVPPTAPKTPAPPAAPGRTSTLQECWEKLCAAMQGEPQDAMTKNWFAIHEEVLPGKTQDDFSAEEWGRVLARIEKMATARDGIPF